MLRCASSLVIAAYTRVRLTPQDSRALPAAFLRSRPVSTTFKTFYGVVNQRPSPGRTGKRKQACAGISTFCKSAKTAATEYLQTREQNLNILETPSIMNGGHYLTKGHIILCLLYSKTCLMSRNILDPRKNSFPDANSPLLQGRSAPSTPAFWTDHKWTFNASGFRKRKRFRFWCVLFDTEPGRVPG